MTRINSITLLWVLAAICFVVFTATNVFHVNSSDLSITREATHRFQDKYLKTRSTRKRKEHRGKHAGKPRDKNLLRKKDVTIRNEDYLFSFERTKKVELEEEGLSGLKPHAEDHKLGGLSCASYGGPSEEAAVEEMVYWSDIPNDSDYKSPFYTTDEEKYMTFEPDGGGWNNIRMAMETVVTMAHAMGRTLVLPPAQKMYLLGKDSHKQKTYFSFADFFHLGSLNAEHAGLKIIDMEDFLKSTAMQGKLVDKETGLTLFPPGNRTDWNGLKQHEKELFEYLRKVTDVRNWKPSECLAAFPSSTDPDDIPRLRDMVDNLMVNSGGHSPRPNDYNGKPVAVNASAQERMAEALNGRKKLCVYDEEMQKSLVVHFMCYHKERARLLTHFYTFLFFEDWKQDLWTKRFVRDHFRYLDEIQCAAARIVQAVRERARKKGTHEDGVFDSMHVRRGDFQFKATRISAEELHETSKDELTQGVTVYVSTDERDKSFFRPLQEHYDLVFLDDFKDLYKGINTNYYGMLDQLVASKGRVFFGTYYSTFTGYINRMRGYYGVKHKLDGYKEGIINSFYFVPKNQRNAMREYKAVTGVWPREFPVSWRDIDHDLNME